MSNLELLPKRRRGRPAGSKNQDRKQSVKVTMKLAVDAVAIADKHAVAEGIATRTAAIEDLIRRGAKRKVSR